MRDFYRKTVEREGEILDHPIDGVHLNTKRNQQISNSSWKVNCGELSKWTHFIIIITSIEELNLWQLSINKKHSYPTFKFSTKDHVTK